MKKVWLTWKDNKSYDNVRDIKVKARWVDENRQVPKSSWKAFFNAGENPTIYFPAYHSMGQKLCIRFGAQRPALSNNCTYCMDGQGGGEGKDFKKLSTYLSKDDLGFCLCKAVFEYLLSYYYKRCILKCTSSVLMTMHSPRQKRHEGVYSEPDISGTGPVSQWRSPPRAVMKGGSKCSLGSEMCTEKI